MSLRWKQYYRKSRNYIDSSLCNHFLRGLISHAFSSAIWLKVLRLLASLSFLDKLCHSLGQRCLKECLPFTQTFTPCAARAIISQGEHLNYLIVCFSQCTVFFQYVCFLLPICCPCVIRGTYVPTTKSCNVTHHRADIRVAWLVYVRKYGLPIVTLNQNKRSRLLYLGDAQIINTAVDVDVALDVGYNGAEFNCVCCK